MITIILILIACFGGGFVPWWAFLIAILVDVCL